MPLTSKGPTGPTGPTPGRKDLRVGKERAPGQSLIAIPEMSRPGWFYRPSDRRILHRAGKDGHLAQVGGVVPKVTGYVMHLTDDGVPIRGEFQVIGRHGRKRLITPDELERGTWADKCGLRRPIGADARMAFASAINIQADSPDIPEVPARAYYNEAGDLVLPDPDAQTFGYLTCAGGPENEANAREAWSEEIASWAIGDPKTTLALGAAFSGAVLHKLDVFAHILNLIGDGQQGKSTMMCVGAATLGDISPRRQQILMTWNASKQGITQGLRMRGFLPLFLDEHSTAGRTVQDSSKEFTQITAGAIRAMGGADGSLRDIDGFWHSVLLSSSNEPLRYAGQTEALASRLFELHAPFGRNEWVDADGNTADPANGAAEHISKRIKRLARANGGWPLHWANQKGMFRAANLEKIQHRFRELSARFRIASGGIPNTIAETYVAWIVGAEMLGIAIDCPELGPIAEMAARQLLGTAIQEATEANVPDAELLWEALDALRIEASAYPPKDQFEAAAKDRAHTVKGYTDPDNGWWWVIGSVVQEAASAAGIDNRDAALRRLDQLGVRIRGEGKNGQRQLLPKALREVGLGRRMHCFDVDRAAALWAPDDSADDSADAVQATPTDTAPAAEEPRGEQLTLNPLGPPSETAPGQETAEPGGHAEVAPAGAADRVFYPAPAAAVTDQEFAHLVLNAEGWTRSALRFGVLGTDEATGPALRLPNHAPAPVRLPGSVNDVPALMAAYDLKTLWVHASAAEAMGLPTYDERRALPALHHDEDPEDPTDDEQLHGDAAPAGHRPLGPQIPAAHPWVELDPAGPVRELAPGGLASWLTLVIPAGAEDGKDTRLSVALPLYDDRYDKDFRRGGFGGPADAAELLDALMVWTVATSYRHRGRLEVIPFYASVNHTARDFASRGLKPEDREARVKCETVRDQLIPPLLRNSVPLMVPQQWGRELTEAEASMAALHRFDKTAAWLFAFSACPLGIGEPVHAEHGAPFDSKLPGFWRIAQVPGTGPAGLPPLRFRRAEDGGYWISTPSMDLLRELYPAWTPEVIEAWYWPVGMRALEGMYTKVHRTRENIVAAMAAGRPGARWAKQMIGRTYQSFRGYMARTSGPMTDRETGGHYAKDLYYRPDWARLLMDMATANMYRNLRKFADDGVSALAVCVDAVTFASPETDPDTARPASMVSGKARWTHEGSAPLAEVLPALQNPRPGRVAHAHHVLNDYLDTPGE